MLKRENLRPFLKPPTGIGRGHGQRSSGRRKPGRVGGAAKISSEQSQANSDIVFRMRRETEEEYRKRGGRWFYHNVNPEALNALNSLPEGSEFSVYYVGFGSSGESRYVIGTRGMSTRTVMRVNENGKHERAKIAKTKSQLRDAIDMKNAKTITIHNNGNPIKR